MYGGNRTGGFRPRPGGSMGAPTAPVRVGEELDVKIEAVGEKGDGIAKKNGFVLFVPGVKEGQELRIRVTKVLRKVGFAEVVGKAGEKSASAESSESTSEEPVDDAPAEKPAEESSEDSESFGEETEEAGDQSEEQ